MAKHSSITKHHKTTTKVDPELIKLQVFRTPKTHFIPLLDYYPKHFANTKILDPCCGDSRMVKEIWRRGNHNQHTIMDIRSSEYSKWIKHGIIKRLGVSNCITADFLTYKFKKDIYDTVITNPPFKESRLFIDKLRTLVRQNGWIWILQRCDWISTQDRSKWHMANKDLRRILVLIKRPIWEIDDKVDNKADTREYAWFGYQIGYKDYPQVRWLV